MATVDSLVTQGMKDAVLLWLRVTYTDARTGGGGARTMTYTMSVGVVLGGAGYLCVDTSVDPARRRRAISPPPYSSSGVQIENVTMSCENEETLHALKVA